jgi:hypothetical protein
MHIKSLSVHKQLGAAQITAALSQVQLLDNFIVATIQPNTSPKQNIYKTAEKPPQQII